MQKPRKVKGIPFQLIYESKEKKLWAKEKLNDLVQSEGWAILKGVIQHWQKQVENEMFNLPADASTEVRRKERLHLEKLSLLPDSLLEDLFRKDSIEDADPYENSSEPLSL